MRSINKITLLGRLGKDPMVRETSDGKLFMRFPLATERTWISNTGEKGSRTEWHQCLIWTPGLIQVLQNRMFKGDPLHIEGHLEYHKTLRDGVQTYPATIVCNQVVLLSQPKKQLVTSGDSPYENDVDSGW